MLSWLIVKMSVELQHSKARRRLSCYDVILGLVTMLQKMQILGEHSKAIAKGLAKKKSRDSIVSIDVVYRHIYIYIYISLTCHFFILYR